MLLKGYHPFLKSAGRQRFCVHQVTLLDSGQASAETARGRERYLTASVSNNNVPMVSERWSAKMTLCQARYAENHLVRLKPLFLLFLLL